MRQEEESPFFPPQYLLLWHHQSTSSISYIHQFCMNFFPWGFKYWSHVDFLKFSLLLLLLHQPSCPMYFSFINITKVSIRQKLGNHNSIFLVFFFPFVILWVLGIEPLESFCWTQFSLFILCTRLWAISLNNPISKSRLLEIIWWSGDL
jgi:hypothetical protein